MKKLPVLIFAFNFLALPALAQTDDIEITVTGTRSPRPVQDAPGSVIVIDRDDIQRSNVSNLRDLLRYEPGISVQQSPRFGFQNFNIRGIEGNRILFQVDGIRLPIQFELPPFSTGRDFIDLSTLKTVEILKGPGSALYGSDAIGGTLTFTTIDPGNLLAITGQDTYLGINSGYSSSNSGFSNTLEFATKVDKLEIATIYTRRDFRELNRNGDPQFNDPQSGGSNNYFGKIVYKFDDNSALKFTTEVLNRSTFTTIALANTVQETGGARTIQNLTSDFRTNRNRFSLDYDFQNPDSSFIQVAKIQAYYQYTTTPEFTVEDRLVAPTGSRPGTPATQLATRVGINDFLDRIYGANLQLQSNFNTGDLRHSLIYGAEISSQRNERPRQREQINRVTGERTQNFIPENFPTKDFPDSDTSRFALFLQDEIVIGNSNVSVIPGIRFDSYSLTATADEDFLRNGSPSPTNFSSSNISPRVSIVWKASPEFTIFGQYARGFRAPLFDEINSGFANTLAGYRVVPNPDLKAETSDGFEIGVRGRFPQGKLSLVGFYNTYDNLIQRFVNTGTENIPGFARPFIRFQTQNVASARIYGVELSGEYRFNERPEGISIFGGLAYTIGDNQTTNQPLNTINPFKANTGIRYRGAENRWGLEFVGTFVGSPRVPLTTQLFIPAGYTVFDLTGYINFTPLISLNFGVYNLFNQKYFEYSDLRTFPAADAFRVDRLAQPGTNVAVGLNLKF